MHPDDVPGSWHVLGQGESLDDVARAAGVPVEDVLEANGLENAAQAQPGRLLFVLSTRAPVAPDLSPLRTGQGRGPAPPTPRPAAATLPPVPAVVVSRAAVSDARLRWPVTHPVLSSPFGRRDGRVHEGIDMAVPVGTPVLAAADGEVLYASNGIRGYGHLVVLQHPGDILTVYAHNSLLLVRPGDRVAAGQQIAASGQSGRATGPHLHFEVRQGQTPRDPMTFLPSPGSQP